MAIEVIQKVLMLKPDRITATERSVLVVMANYVRSRADGSFTEAYTSVPTIHRNSSLSRRAIQNAQRRLCAKGFITLVGAKARGVALHYVINIKQLDCARGAQSWDQDRAPGATDSAPGATNCALGAATSAPRAPKPDLNQPEPERQREAANAAPSHAGSPPDLNARERTAECLAALWNDRTTPPILRCEQLTLERRRHCRARLRERPLQEWANVFSRIEASEFCRSVNDRGWVASLDWAIGSPDVAVQVLEGKYDNRPGRERSFTDTEIRDARRTRDVAGGCRHEPRCENWSACVAAIIRQWRLDAGA